MPPGWTALWTGVARTPERTKQPWEPPPRPPQPPGPGSSHLPVRRATYPGPLTRLGRSLSPNLRGVYLVAPGRRRGLGSARTRTGRPGSGRGRGRGRGGRGRDRGGRGKRAAPERRAGGDCRITPPSGPKPSRAAAWVGEPLESQPQIQGWPSLTVQPLAMVTIAMVVYYAPSACQVLRTL